MIRKRCRMMSAVERQQMQADVTEREREREKGLVLNDINRLALILKKRPTSSKVKKADLWENWPTQVVSEDCRFVDICCYQ